jgi:hypothetical protein
MKTIRQTATVRGATPHEIYETVHGLEEAHEARWLTDDSERRAGGAFKAGRDLEGKHCKLVKDEKIVQTWRAKVAAIEPDDWPLKGEGLGAFPFRP